MVTNGYVLTGSADLQSILQDKIALLTLSGDPVFGDIMGIDHQDVTTLIWEQKDNWTGLTAPRALGGPFGRVKREGLSTWKVDPSSFGDQKEMLEEYLTVGREIGTFGSAIDIRKAQAEDQDHLISRMVSRLKKMAWDLVVTGVYQVFNGQTQLIATDKFTFPSFTATHAWSDRVNATPLDDLFNMKIKARGHSVAFDEKSRLYLNATWINHFLMNENPDDIGGRRKVNARGQIQPMDLGDANEILTDRKLPSLYEWDDGYQDDNNAFQIFIPDGHGALIGRRLTNEKVIEYVFTRNANNTAVGRGAAEIYTDFEFKKNPIRGITTLGFNGALKVDFPSAVMQVTL